MLETQVRLCLAGPDFREFLFYLKIGKIDKKWPKTGFFDFIEKFGHFSKNVWVGLVKTESLNKI